MSKPKRKFKKFTKAERESLRLDKVPDTMYDLRYPKEQAEEYPEYERKNPVAVDKEIKS